MSVRSVLLTSARLQADHGNSGTRSKTPHP